MANWKTFTCHIEGTYPYMAYRMTEQDQAGLTKGTRRTHTAPTDPREVAESHTYRDSTGKLYHPAESIPALLKEAGRNHKQRSSRRSLAYIIPAAIRMADEHIYLFDGDGKRADHFEVDTRTGVNRTTKGRVLIHRPRLNLWSGEFFIKVNQDILEPSMVRQLLNEGGELIGIGSFRPEKGGPFGTFAVTLWEETTNSQVTKRKRANRLDRIEVAGDN